MPSAKRTSPAQRAKSPTSSINIAKLSSIAYAFHPSEFDRRAPNSALMHIKGNVVGAKSLRETCDSRRYSVTTLIGGKP